MAKDPSEMERPTVLKKGTRYLIICQDPKYATRNRFSGIGIYQGRMKGNRYEFFIPSTYRVEYFRKDFIFKAELGAESEQNDY